MSTAIEIMTALTSHAVEVVMAGDRVRLLLPEDRPPPAELIEAARKHKEELRAILENRREIRPSSPYGHLLTELQSKCPELVEPDRWQQAIRDADNFLATWGAKAQAFGWTERELFGLHPVPEQPAPNYSRLSRLDHTGLIWLLRGRPVIALTAAEAVMRCHSGATLTYRRQNEPVAKAAEIDEATLDAAEIAKGATA
jgi:hypothetical protein